MYNTDSRSMSERELFEAVMENFNIWKTLYGRKRRRRRIKAKKIITGGGGE